MVALNYRRFVSCDILLATGADVDGIMDREDDSLRCGTWSMLGTKALLTTS